MIDTRPMQQRFQKLRGDILHQSGVLTAQTQNYPFSIFVYSPSEEYEVRKEFSALKYELEKQSFRAHEINLADLLISLLKSDADKYDLPYMIQKESESFGSTKDINRNLILLSDQLGNTIGDQEGICKLINQRIADFVAAHQDGRKIIFITRAGFLYPYLKTSALLSFLEVPPGLPIILLYPGERAGDSALKYMGVKPPDANYRPRIY